MLLKDKISRIATIIICCCGLFVFSFYIHHPYPLRFFSLGGLMVAAFIIHLQIPSFSVCKNIFGSVALSGRSVWLFLVAVILGLSVATWYRYYLGMPLFLSSISSFTIMAALVGAMEELVFRGFVQGSLQKVNVTFSIFAGALSHTVYKACLFLSPFMANKIDIFHLMTWTFVFGLVFGFLRQYAKSVFFPLIAHALFDILVYGELIMAPWWVW